MKTKIRFITDIIVTVIMIPYSIVWLFEISGNIEGIMSFYGVFRNGIAFYHRRLSYKVGTFQKQSRTHRKEVQSSIDIGSDLGCVFYSCHFIVCNMGLKPSPLGETLRSTFCNYNNLLGNTNLRGEKYGKLQNFVALHI